MKSIILSVHGEYIDSMARGDKVEELRKEKPQGGAPFRVYLYRTRDGTDAGGKIVGEFICDAIREYDRTDRDRLLAAARGAVSPGALRHYWGRRATLYGWRIAHLIFYARPRGLEEYGLTRPPQSWCYAREEPEE